MSDKTTTTLTIHWAPFGPNDVAGTLCHGDEALWGHASSSFGWLEADLTRNFGRAADLSERFPAGFDIEWNPTR